MDTSDGSTNYQKRKESFQRYRRKTLLYYLQFSLRDAEAREWFEHTGKDGAYLKKLILEDKARMLENLASNEPLPDYRALYFHMLRARNAEKRLLEGPADAKQIKPKRHRRNKAEMEHVRDLSHHQRYKETHDKYLTKILRFSFQFSLKDGEAREWFERHEEKGPYLKFLILQDKERSLKRGLSAPDKGTGTEAWPVVPHEEKTSIRSQLAAAKADPIEKPPAKSKNKEAR